MAKKNQKKSMNAYARFSSMGIQMGILIFLGVYGGQALDEKLELETPWMTILGSLLGVFLGLYIVLKGVINMNKINEND